MSFSAGALLEYQDHRLYVLTNIKHRFKEYTACIDLTRTIETNNDYISVVILYQTSPQNFGWVEDDKLFNILYKKSESKLLEKTKNFINMYEDINGSDPTFTEEEKKIIRDYIRLTTHIC